MSLRSGVGTVEAVLFDLDDVLVPFHTPRAWQWAWKPQGPLLGERRVRSAVRRSLKAWDHRRWLGVTGKGPAPDLAALTEHLGATLATIAGHPLPPDETAAVVRRMLRPAGEVERYPDVGPLLERLRAQSVKVGVVTPLPAESAIWLLKRGGFSPALLVGSGDGPTPPVPDRAAFRAATAALGPEPRTTAFVGDLFWSDVRAAARAGLVPVLLDRHDAWPNVQGGRVPTLGEFEAALAAGPLPSDAEPGGSDPGPDGLPGRREQEHL